MAEDPRRLFDAKDVEAAALYAQRVGGSDFYPLKLDADGYLLTNLTVGTITAQLSSTASTITNAASNPVPVTGSINIATATLGTVTVALTSTEVTVKSAVAGFNVNVATATLGTVTTSLASTLVTIQNTAGVVNVSVRSATLGTVVTSLSSTIVTIAPQAGTSLATTACTITNPVGNPVNVSLTNTAVTAKVSQNPIAPVLLSSVISFTATGSTIITAVTAVLHRVYRMAFTVSSSTLVQVRAGSTSLTGWMPLGANGGMVLDFDGEPWFSTGTNEALSLDTTNSTGVAGRVYYTRV